MGCLKIGIASHIVLDTIKGTAGRVVGELMRSSVPDLWLRWAIVLFSFAQIGGILLFFHTMWGRIRPVGSQIREAKGERF